MSQNLTQQEIKKYVPEQLKRQIFSLQLNDGRYGLEYDPLGQSLLLWSSTGHVSMLRLRDMELMAEKKFDFGVHGACFITGGLVALACQESVRILDQQLL